MAARSIKAISWDKWAKCSSTEDIVPLLKLAAGSGQSNTLITNKVEHRLTQLATTMGVQEGKVILQEAARRKHLHAAIMESDRRFKEAEEARRRDEEERLARELEKKEQRRIEEERRAEERRLRTEKDEARRIEMSKEIAQRLEAQHDPEKEKKMLELDAMEREQKDKLTEEMRRIQEEKQRSREEQAKKAKEERESLLATATQSSWKDDDVVDYHAQDVFEDGDPTEDTKWGQAPISIKDMLSQEKDMGIFVEEEEAAATVEAPADPVVVTFDPQVLCSAEGWVPSADNSAETEKVLGGNMNIDIVKESVGGGSSPADRRGHLRDLSESTPKPGKHLSQLILYSKLAGQAKRVRQNIATWVSQLTPTDDISQILKTATDSLGAYDFFTRLVQAKAKLTDIQFRTLIQAIKIEVAMKPTWVAAANDVFEYISTLGKNNGYIDYPLSLVALFKLVIGQPMLGSRYWKEVGDTGPPQNVLLAAVESISSSEKIVTHRYRPPKEKLNQDDYLERAGAIFQMYLDNENDDEIDVADPNRRVRTKSFTLHVTQLASAVRMLMLALIEKGEFEKVDELWKAVRTRVGSSIRSAYLKRFVKDPDADPHLAKQQFVAIPDELRNDKDLVLVIRAFAGKGDSHSCEDLYQFRDNANKLNKILYLTEMVTAYERNARQAEATMDKRCDMFVDGWNSLYDRLEKLKDPKSKQGRTSSPLLAFLVRSIESINVMYVGPMSVSHDEHCIIPNRKLLELSDKIREAGGYIPGLAKRQSDVLLVKLLDLYVKSVDEDRANILMGCAEFDTLPNKEPILRGVQNRLRMIYNAKHLKLNPHLRRSPAPTTPDADGDSQDPAIPDNIPTPVSA